MFRFKYGLPVLPKVRRNSNGRTAEGGINRVSVLPPYLVLPFSTHAHRGACAHTRARMQICLQVRQGKEVGQRKGLYGFAPSYLRPALLHRRTKQFTRKETIWM